MTAGLDERAVKPRKRKKHNQYFTPEYVASAAFSLIPAKAAIETVIDPAVGEGAFLRAASEKWERASLFGIDVDEAVVSRAQALGLRNAFLNCADGLSSAALESTLGVRRVLEDGGFDLVAGNPPFSSWFSRVCTPHLLSSYQLGRANGRPLPSQAIEILFLEAFVNLARIGGFVVIVLPEGVLANPKYRYVREFILEKTIVRHIVSLPRGVFRDTAAKTSVLLLEKRPGSDLTYAVSLSTLETTGTLNGTIELEARRLTGRMDYAHHLGVASCTGAPSASGWVDFRPLGDFVVYFRTGKTLYGKERAFSKTGLRFLHATNITEAGIDYKRDERFIDPASPMNSPRAHVKIGDILLVRVGVGCAGRVAIVDSEDDEGVATDYVHIFRVTGIDPHFLVAYLKSKRGREAINLLKHGVATVSLNKSDLLSVPVPVLPEPDQRRIATRYREIIRARRRGFPEAAAKERMELLLRQLDGHLTDRNVMWKCAPRRLTRRNSRGSRPRNLVDSGISLTRDL